MTSFITALRRRFCAHEVFIEEIKRLSPNQVTAPCNRCGAELFAGYGLALKAKLLQRRPQHWIEGDSRGGDDRG